MTAQTSAQACSTYDNTDSVTTTNDGTDQSSAGITCNQASIHILKTADAATVNAGDPIGFHVTVTTTGGRTATGECVSGSVAGGSGPGVTWTVESQSLTGP